MFSILAGIMILILYVSEQVYIFSLEKKVIELKKESQECMTQITNLKLKTVELRKGSRIKKYAHDFGLIMPEGAPEKLF